MNFCFTPARNDDSFRDDGGCGHGKKGWSQKTEKVTLRGCDGFYEGYDQAGGGQG